MAHVSYNVYFIYLFSNNINYLIILFLFHRYFFLYELFGLHLFVTVRQFLFIFGLSQPSVYALESET